MSATMYEPNGDEGSMPCFDLYIKSSTIDHVSRGSCPLCQQWFMVSYSLAKADTIRFKVHPIEANMPPKEFKEKTRSKLFPVVIGISGENNMGQDITGLVADSHDEVENFFESVSNDCPSLKEDFPACRQALSACDNLYKDFNRFLQNPDDNVGKKLISDLANINMYLVNQGRPFLCGDDISYADCFLLPRLQHIRVAGQAYKNFEIPQDLSSLRAYLCVAYENEAFLATLPSDQDIILHYETKAEKKVHVDKLLKSTYTTEFVN